MKDTASIVIENKMREFPEDDFYLAESEATRNRIELKLAKHNLAETVSKYNLIFDNASAGIAFIAPNGQWLDMNSRLCQILGYSQEELLMLTFHDVTHPADQDLSFRNAGHMLQGRLKNCSFQKRYLHKDGSIVWAQVTYVLTFFPSGRPKYFVEYIEDITARKNLETKVKLLREELALLTGRGYSPPTFPEV